MREQYGTAVGAAAPDRASGSKDGDGDDDERADGGGFLTRADDVVQHHNLPRPVHVVFASPPPRSPAPDDRTPTPATSPTPVPDEPVLPLDSDSDVQHPADNPVENRGIPKSMAELAAEAEAAAAQMSNSSSSSTGGEAVSVTGRANKEEGPCGRVGRSVCVLARVKTRTIGNPTMGTRRTREARSRGGRETRSACVRGPGPGPVVLIGRRLCPYRYRRPIACFVRAKSKSPSSV
jgi:hypothetical protein